MKRWLIIIAIAFALLLIPSPTLAATSADVTITAAGYICGAPGGFVLTYISDYEVGISWTKGADAENTMIRAKYGSVPTSRTDGYQVYYGSDNSTSDTAVSLDETATPIYYAAFSQNAGGGWEEVGVSGFLEGMGMTIIAIAMIVLGLTIAAFVFKQPLLMLAGALGWIIFAFLMFNKPIEGNDYLPTAFLLFGGAMAFLCLFAAIGIYVPGRKALSEDAEYEAYRKEVMKATRKR